MDISNFVGGIIGGVVGSTAIAGIAAFVGKFVLATLKDRWILEVKAEHATALEKMKDSLEREQKVLQARLESGTYVTKAQYDLELEAYKELWLTMNELRERWKGARVQAGLYFKDEETRLAVLNLAGTQAAEANDNAVLVSGKFTPFYDRNVYMAAQAATQASTQLLVRLNECGAAQTALPAEEIEMRWGAICQAVEQIDVLICARLESLRLV